MIVEDQLDRGAGRISGVEKLEEFDELPAAIAVPDQGVDLAGEQIDPGQQAERAMAFVFMIASEGGVHAGFGRQVRRRCCDGLDSWLFIAGDDGHRVSLLLRLGGGFFQNRDFTIDAQNLPPSSVRIRRRGFQDSSTPYAA